MSKKTDQLLIAYFPTAEAAHEAAKEVKEWDKNLIKIDLGAIGILTMDEDGKVKTENIGDRATGKGAKWGLVVGAVTGVAIDRTLGIDDDLVCLRSREESDVCMSSHQIPVV